MTILPALIPALLDSAAAALALTSLFALVAWRLRAVTPSGAMAGAAAALAVYAGGGPGGFATLVLVFVVTWASTRLGATRKQRLGVAERARGRSAIQVFANLALAAAACLASIFTPYRGALLLAAVAALAEAAADTASSECGQALSPRAWLITSGERVPVGTDGGVSLVGSLCGVLAAVMVVASGAAFRLVAPGAVLPAILGAVAGMFFDSLLGATLERRRLLSNEGVNFLGTVAAAGLAVLLAQL
jgi:uncharacterized protein (TIGR00297 family)